MDLVDNQMDYADVEKKHNVPYNLLVTWTRRNKWPTKAKTKKILAKVGSEVNEQTAQTIAKTLLARGQAHAEKVFAKASLACATSKVSAPKNWKDFEIADRVARRAAGMNDDQTVLNTTLVHINEARDEDIEPVHTADVIVAAESDTERSVESPPHDPYHTQALELPSPQTP